VKLERQNLARSLEWAAFFLLLMTLAARPFIAEMPYRAPIVAVGSMSAGQGAGTAMPRDREEFSRVTFAVLILAIGALWVVGGAVGGGIKVRGGWLGVLIAAFGVLSLASTLAASDQRTALDCWVEQLSLLVAAFLAVQLCADKRRFVLLAILLGALAAAMAAQGFWQRAETSSNVADFNMYRDEFLAAHGWVAGSPQDQAAEARFKDTAVRGFFALSNMFASLMIVLTLACGGLAFANLREAIGRRKATSGEPQATSHKPQATKGKAVTLSQRAGDIQIDPQMIAGVAALLGAAAGAVVLAMALSRGGVIAGALAAIAAVVVYAKRASLARHWKRWLLCVALGLVLVGAGVTAWGLTPDGLPIPGSATKTMTFRWFYWTGSVQIIRDNPLLGVGGGNFDTAYLQHRRAAAEESVKMPHNVLLHSLTQFGIPGGLCYIAIIAMVLVGASRPGGDREGNISPPGEQEFPRSSGGSASNRRLLLALVLLAPLAALVTRWMFGGVAAGDQKEIISSLLVDAVSPAVILAGRWRYWGWRGREGSGFSVAQPFQAVNWRCTRRGGCYRFGLRWRAAAGDFSFTGLWR
jgi:O-antigen ligase